MIYRLQFANLCTSILITVCIHASTKQVSALCVFASLTRVCGCSFFQLLGRAAQVGDYVRRGADWGSVKLTFRGQEPGSTITVYRQIHKNNNSKWQLNGETLDCLTRKVDLKWSCACLMQQRFLGTAEVPESALQLSFRFATACKALVLSCSMRRNPYINDTQQQRIVPKHLVRRSFERAVLMVQERIARRRMSSAWSRSLTSKLETSARYDSLLLLLAAIPTLLLQTGTAKHVTALFLLQGTSCVNLRVSHPQNHLKRPITNQCTC
jgi:hypothetical protein